MLTALQKCPPARLLLALTFSMIAFTTTRAQSFRVSIAPGLADSATQRGLDGRLLLLLSDNNKAEPRFQINDGATTQLVFGIDVENFKNGEAQLLEVNSNPFLISNFFECFSKRYFSSLSKMIKSVVLQSYSRQFESSGYGQSKQTEFFLS